MVFLVGSRLGPSDPIKILSIPSPLILNDDFARALRKTRAASQLLQVSLSGEFSNMPDSTYVQECLAQSSIAEIPIAAGACQHFLQAMENLPQGLTLHDRDTKLVFCNHQYLNMYNLSPLVVRPGISFLELITHRKTTSSFMGEPDKYCADIITALSNGKVIEQYVDSTDGRTIHLKSQSIQGGGWVSLFNDVTATRRVEFALRNSEMNFRTLFELSPDAQIAIADNGTILFANKMARDIFCIDFNEEIDLNAEVLCPEIYSVIRSNDQPSNTHERENSQWWCSKSNVFIRTPDNNALHADINANKIFVGTKDAYCVTIRDISERVSNQRRIQHLAYHDALTGLPNRIALARHWDTLVAKVRRCNSKVAIVSLDLDHFKRANDLYGHMVGDQVLREASNRIKNILTREFIARVGGDEFIIVKRIRNNKKSEMDRFLSELLALFDDPIDIGQTKIKIGITIGVAIFPDNGDCFEAVISNSDIALYHAKQQGRGKSYRFDKKLSEAILWKRNIQYDLERAIKGKEIGLHYQLQTNMEKEPIGFEALARWMHPKNGPIPPDLFIPLAEELSLIVELGNKLMFDACLEAASWKVPFRLSVNVSPMQILQPKFSETVRSILNDTRLEAHRLVIEITENVLINDKNQAAIALKRLKDIGVNIALDDFGTRYSSLSYLHEFNFDRIKIDKTFISNMHKNEKSAHILRAIIHMGRSLSIPILAEGVEHEYQLEFLRQEGCREIQGYLVGKPTSIEHYAALTMPAIYAGKRVV